MDNQYRYRQAEAKDIEIVTELLCELYKDHNYNELFDENKKHFANNTQSFFLGFDGDDAIGVCHAALRIEYVNGKVYDETAGYLEAVYVRSDYRLRGVAANLVALCEQWALRNGCREFLSDCLLENTDSYKFHLRLGFAETERCIFFRKDI